MASQLHFLVVNPGDVPPSSPRPVFLLRADDWDDYGHAVLFHLSYVGRDKVRTHIGSVRILQRTSSPGEPIEVAKKTILPGSFTALDERFVSLGQEDRYYLHLRNLDEISTAEVLDALRDIAWRPAFASEFEPTAAFRNAMMRQNTAHRARRFGRQWALGIPAREDLAFRYAGSIEGAASEVEAVFDFDARDLVPGRIVGIIGRNAVGKTRFLASLGADLAQVARSSAKTLKKRDDRFPEGRPLFTRIIAISYSAFDRFKRPPHDSASSYVYCGIRSDGGGLSRASLVRAYRENLARIHSRGEQDRWAGHMRTILGDQSEQLTVSLEAEMSKAAPGSTTLSLLSSGQSILAHFVTALLAWIQPSSLVLFDEPETHLHPNAVASLFLVLSEILQEFKSYAVVATHSPVVIQEIPAKRVLMFERVGDVTTAQPLMTESFGESVTELTRHVFETDEVKSVYRRTLGELARRESAAEVLARFDHGLSLSAQAYLLARYGKKRGSAN